MLNFDYSNARAFIDEHQLQYQQQAVQVAHVKLHNKTGLDQDYFGWLDLPHNYDREEFGRIQAAAAYIRENCDALVVIGVGGSYIGARSAIQLLSHTFYNQLPKEKRQAPEIYFAGHNLSATYLQHLVELLADKDICVNVISKSGTTTETAIAFRIFKGLLEQKYGRAEAQKRIFATTDKTKGALRQLAEEEGYGTFVIPDNIGGRYSVLTAVGLLPIAVNGIDIEQIMAGAAQAADHYNNPHLAENHCYQYAAIRNILYKQGKEIELLVHYEPALHYFSEWWKQLFGESEGKDHKGIFPAAVQFSTDLHSMGQYIQQGRRHLFETVINIEKPPLEMTIPHDRQNLDGLNYLADKSLNYVNKQAFKGTLWAHIDGGVPNLLLNVPEISPYYYGQLVYFFEKACAISGFLLGVNPFDQPGVEEYKKNMFALLGKPGYEQQRERLINR